MKNRIGIVVGSTRPGRVGLKVAEWYLDQVKNVEDAEFEIIDLLEVNLPILDEAIPAMAGQYQHEHTKKWSKLIDEFDAYVWVTPEYNHAAPAALTNAISFLNAEWARKPVALVSYGSMGGVRAAENLRLIAGELQLVDVKPTVMLLEPWAMFNDDGTIKPELIKGAPATSQIEDLLWWSGALQAKKAAEATSAA